MTARITQEKEEDSQFVKDLKDVHLVYDYNARDARGNPEKWRYETWFFSEVYFIFSQAVSLSVFASVFFVFILCLFFFP